MTYRLTVAIGVEFTSASYEMAEGSEVLRLSPFAVDLPSARFLTDDGLRTDADQSIMVVECRAEGRPDRLLVIKLDGTVVRQLKTGQPRIEDPMISPDGRTVAYWGHDARSGPNGGSIYTVAMDGSSEPVQLTDRKAGSDADPAWSPDGTMIAFRRRVSNDNLDVYVMRSDGSGVRPVATGPAVDEKPAWSPDGRQLDDHL